jgi:hypothetical protein
MAWPTDPGLADDDTDAVVWVADAVVVVVVGKALP